MLFSHLEGFGASSRVLRRLPSPKNALGKTTAASSHPRNHHRLLKIFHRPHCEQCHVGTIFFMLNYNVPFFLFSQFVHPRFSFHHLISWHLSPSWPDSTVMARTLKWTRAQERDHIHDCTAKVNLVARSSDRSVCQRCRRGRWLAGKGGVQKKKVCHVNERNLAKR